MLNANDVALLKELWMYIKDLLLGFIGGVFSYIVPFYKDYQTGKVFLFGVFFTKAFLGMMASWIVGGYLGASVPFRDAVVFGIGFAAFTVATAIDRQFVIQLLEMWIGSMKNK